MGSDCIDFGLRNVWKAWRAFRKGKRVTGELHLFQYYLEKNLHALHEDLIAGTYRHGSYRKFTVSENKRREISVAPIRDRVVHRLVYDYLKFTYDRAFIDDAWSCRPNKGLLGAIQRTQYFLKKHPRSFIWKGDVKKFFDSVDHATLLRVLSHRIKEERAYTLLTKIIKSFAVDKSGGGVCGIPIGNLTSQIFANIYLNEFDRFAKHDLRPRAYLRYGDDFIMIGSAVDNLRTLRLEAIRFLEKVLKLQINAKNDQIVQSRDGLKFLGVQLWPNGRALSVRNFTRVERRLNLRNALSYHGLISKHEGLRRRKQFDWWVSELLS